MATIVGGNPGQSHVGSDTENDSIWGAGGSDTIRGGPAAGTGGGNDFLDGGAGTDVIYGGDGSDTLIGGGGNTSDTLYGGAGTDTADYSQHLTGLTAGGVGTFTQNNTAVNVNLATGVASGAYGTDSLFDIENVIGGGGADTITGSTVANLLDGGAGADTIYGGVGADTLIGGDGADSLYGGVDNDLLYGGAGVDRLDGGSGADTLVGGANADILVGGLGSDTADYSASAAGVNVNINDAVVESGGDAAGDSLSGIENLTGSGSGDTLVGNNSANILFGGAGGDSIVGNLGSDSIDGGTGDDTINAGPDTLSGTTPAAANEFLDWTTGGPANIPANFTQDTGTMRVTVDYVQGAGSGYSVNTGAIYSPETLIGNNSGATLSRTGAGELTELSINFAAEAGGGMTNEVTNVQFRISDIDRSGWRDTVTILAYDELGNLIPVNISTTSGEITISGNTASATATANNTNQDLADGSILINIPGPVAQIVIQYADLQDSGQFIVISDVHFTTIPATPDTADADTVTGGLGNDLIETGLGADLIYGNEDRDTISGEAGNDTLYGGTENDLLYGGTEDDFVYGGNDQDTLYGDAGNDTLYGDAANDVLYGGDGLDTLYGGDGQDTIQGGIGNDLIYGGLNADSIDAGDGSDIVYGDDGNDVINFGLGNDTVFGGAGNDLIDDQASGALPGFNLIYGGIGNDTVFTGEDGDTLYGDEGNDVLNGEGGNDQLFGGIDDDRLYGGANEDTLYGEVGNDTLYGDFGNDQLYGGAGLDTLYGGGDNDLLYGDADNDLLYGGAGRDTIYGGDDQDRIYVGFNTAYNDTLLGSFAATNDVANGEIVDGNNGGIDNDTLTVNITGFGWAQMDLVYDPLNNENGTITFYAGDGITVVGTLVFTEIENLIIVCFTAGTQILTERGPVAVEALGPGDLVMTRDNGLQPLRWVGSRVLSYADLLARPQLQPVRIGAGAFAGAGPDRTMLVSPQHRVLIEGARAEMYFGESEVLVPAKHLTGLAEVTRALPSEGVTYVHILFDRHEIVQSDGLWTESFQPAERTLGALEEAARAEVLELFPELAQNTDAFPSARLSLKAHEARVLVAD